MVLEFHKQIYSIEHEHLTLRRFYKFGVISPLSKKEENFVMKKTQEVFELEKLYKV